MDLDVDELLDVDQRVRELTTELDEAQAKRKSSAKEFAKADETRRAELRAEHKELETRLSQLREQLDEASAQLQELLLRTPTIPWEGAPVGGRVGQRDDQELGPGARVRLHAAGPRRAAGKARLGRVRPGPQGGRRTRLRAEEGSRAARAGAALLRPRRAAGPGLHRDLGPVPGDRDAADRDRPVPGAPRGDLRDPGRRPVPGGYGRGGPGRPAQRRDPGQEAAADPVRGDLAVLPPRGRAAPAGTCAACCGCTSSRRSSSS